MFKNGHLPWCLRNQCLCKAKGYAVVIVLAIAVGLLELWGHVESASFAILGDALHVASHVIVYSVAMRASILIARSKSLEKSDEIDRRSALVNVNLLILLACGSIAMAARSFMHPLEIKGDTLLWVSVIGLAANVWMYYILKRFKIKHHHGNEEQRDHVRETALLDLAFDTATSVIVVAEAIVVISWPWMVEWRIDSIALIAISLILIVLALLIKKGIKAHEKKSKTAG